MNIYSVWFSDSQGFMAQIDSKAITFRQIWLCDAICSCATSVGLIRSHFQYEFKMIVRKNLFDTLDCVDCSDFHTLSSNSAINQNIHTFTADNCSRDNWLIHSFPSFLVFFSIASLSLKIKLSWNYNGLNDYIVCKLSIQNIETYR